MFQEGWSLERQGGSRWRLTLGKEVADLVKVVDVIKVLLVKTGCEGRR
jgi:hypothetical protein